MSVFVVYSIRIVYNSMIVCYNYKMAKLIPQHIDVNKLGSLGIYELRNIARALGVARPTTLVRRDLVNAIIDVVNGNSEASYSVRGRPPRDLTFDITRVLEEESLLCSVFDVADEPPCVRSTTSGEVRAVSGYFHMSPRGSGSLISPELFTYSVPLKLISAYGLATGDFLEAKATYNPVRGSFAVEEINKVNGSVSTKYATSPTVRFEKLEGIRPRQTKQINGGSFKLGHRVVVSTSKEFDRIEDISIIAKQIPDEYKIALVIEETDDCVKYLLDNSINEVFLSKPEHNYKKHVLLCLNALFTAKRRAESGKDVILFIDNMTKLFKVYNNSSVTDGQMPVSRINLSSITDAKIFFMSARALEQGGSLTILGYVSSSSNQTDELILNELSDLANIIISK